jgi:hypothetical protein
MLNLKEIDSLEITTLIDNYSDLLLADQEGLCHFRRAAFKRGAKFGLRVGTNRQRIKSVKPGQNYPHALHRLARHTLPEPGDTGSLYFK